MNWVRVWLGAFIGSFAYVTVLAAQSGAGITLPDMMNGAGFAAGAGALIAWGTQKERVQGHERRLEALEIDRVTRAEFETMGGSIRQIEEDIRAMRDSSSANLRQVLEMLERRSIPRRD